VPSPEVARAVDVPAQSGKATFADRWRAWRDRQLTKASFRDWAASFALTRPIARRRALGLFDVMAGFVYSQVLAACVQLRLFELLAEGPLTAEEVGRRLALPLDGAQRLLAAAASIDLLEQRGGGRYGLGPLGAPLVDDQAIVAMVRHHAALYADLRDPVALLRGGSAGSELGRYWPYAGYGVQEGLTDQRVAEYSALMSASQPLVAAEVLAAYPLRRHRRLLDVGGGEGRFLAAAARAAPDLQLMLFDLPPVAELARGWLAGQGLASRAEVRGGDFMADPLPHGADVISLVRVLFDHPDDRVRPLLRRVHDALAPGGTVLVAEPMSGTPGAARMGDAYFGFYLLAMGHGRPRSAEEHMGLLSDAGFSAARCVPTRLPIQTSLVVATRR
jgi:demethylspheroidene O-methyltransferase